MFEQQVGRELQPEPIFELDDQEHRVGGVEAHAGERHLRVYRLVRQRTFQVFHTPISDRGFARIFSPQNKAPCNDPGSTRGSLTAPRSAGQEGFASALISAKLVRARSQGSDDMRLRDRIGIDVGRRLRLEEAIAWAAAHDVRYIDIQLDTADNVFTGFDEARAAGIRLACQKHDVHLGLHTLSAVNVAEYSPFLSEALYRYLRGYVDVYGRLGAQSIVVHAGYH